MKNFIPEILKQLDMELRLFHIWDLKSGAKSQKLSSALESFKTKIHKWEPEYDFRLCTTYLHHVGFVNVI